MAPRSRPAPRCRPLSRRADIRSGRQPKRGDRRACPNAPAKVPRPDLLSWVLPRPTSSALRCRPWPGRCAPSGCSTPVPASTCSGTCPRGEPRSSAGSAPCRGSSVRSRRPGSSCCRAGQPSWASGSGWVRPPHCSGSRRTNSSTRWCRWTTCGVTAPSGSASSSPPPRHPPAEAAIGVLQNQLATLRAVTTRPDPLVATAVRRLMPWETADIGALTRELDISTSQLRRRFLSVVGVAPKTLVMHAALPGLPRPRPGRRRGRRPRRRQAGGPRCGSRVRRPVAPRSRVPPARRAHSTAAARRPGGQLRARARSLGFLPAVSRRCTARP